MMVALLLYGYSWGLYSSRQLARACEEWVDVMAVTGLNRPDFRTIAGFRKRHVVSLSGLFVQVLRLCRAAGMVQFAHVAVDGTKLKANAPRHNAMSYDRMKTADPPSYWWTPLIRSWGARKVFNDEQDPTRVHSRVQAAGDRAAGEQRAPTDADRGGVGYLALDAADLASGLPRGGAPVAQERSGHVSFVTRRLASRSGCQDRALAP
ncbi:hypothetical protein OCOJLMKI_4996 [Methylobacterium iners]|uniref:Transposase InsH N-terminal domain-containing protein n=1 Tax=Methylobacterium iners TaxID=418707 RepID=A0ABQ4S3Q9_9HYPH|nr:hypothetical protein OCOJLMKI_4996 [Methylobacterium iners]